jgi:uncharacterized protein YacL
LRLAIKGFVLATLSAVLAAEIGFILQGVVQSWAYRMPAWAPSFDDLPIMGAISLYFLLFSVVSLVVFCVPLTAILSKYRHESRIAYAVAGFVVGMAVATVIFTPMFEPYTYTIFSFHLLCGALPGAVAGLVWWHAYRSKIAADPAR